MLLDINRVVRRYAEADWIEGIMLFYAFESRVTIRDIDGAVRQWADWEPRSKY